MALDDDDDIDGPTDDKYKADDQSIVEEIYHEALEDLVYSKLDEIVATEVDTHGEAWLDLSDAEHQVLYSMNYTGMLEGSVAGLVTLVGLRQARRVLFRPRLSKTHTGGGGTRTGTTTPTAPPTMMSAVPSSPLFMSSPITAVRPPSVSAAAVSSSKSTFRQQLDRLAHSRIGMVLGWLTDLVISGTVAASVADAYMDEDKMLQEMAEIPLLAGPSTVSRYFCPVVQDALAQLRREATTPVETAALTRPVTPHLTAWLAFAHNCQLRQLQEQLIRRQQGLREDAIVSIPPPGVSSSSRLYGDDYDDNDDGLRNALDNPDVRFADMMDHNGNDDDDRPQDDSRRRPRK